MIVGTRETPVRCWTVGNYECIIYVVGSMVSAWVNTPSRSTC